MAVSNPAPVTLGAAYEAAGKTKLNGYYRMQDMTPSICAAVEEEDDQLQIIDARDNKVYWVAKLKDGHCWMTQNLDLDLGVATLTHNSTTLYHDDTDLGWGTDTVTISWTPTNSTISANASGSFTGWVDDDNYPSSADPGNWYYAGYDGTTLLPNTAVNYLTSADRVTSGGVTTVYDDANYTNAYFRDAPFVGSGTSNNGTHGHVGNYYNWSAAVASNDTSAYVTNTRSDISNNPQNSICPAGWRLPTVSTDSNTTVGSTNEFSRLNLLYNNGVTNSPAGLELAPLYFTRAGSVYESLNFSGKQGSYNSSTVNASYGEYLLRISVGFLDVGSSGYSRSGSYSVRCIAR